MLRNFVHLSKKIPLRHFLKKIYKFNRIVINNVNINKSLFLVNTGFFINKYVTEEFDLNLQKACKNGEEAIIIFMDTVKNDLETISVIYLECLRRQIEIMEENKKLSPLVQRWDDLTEYRTIANELNQDFYNLITILNTLKQMLDNNSLEFITEERTYLEIINNKIDELDRVIENQLIKIKQYEKQLLDCYKDDILLTK